MTCATRLVLSPNSASGDPVVEFHALHGASGKLRGKHLALLVADRLSVDYEADLRVIAKGMEKTVPIRGHAARGIGDRVAEARSGIEGGDLVDQSPVGIDMRGGSNLQHVRAGRLYVNGGLLSGHRQSRLDLDRQGALDGDVLGENAEVAGCDLQVVRVRRNVD